MHQKLFLLGWVHYSYTFSGHQKYIQTSNELKSGNRLNINITLLPFMRKQCSFIILLIELPSLLEWDLYVMLTCGWLCVLQICITGFKLTWQHLDLSRVTADCTSCIFCFLSMRDGCFLMAFFKHLMAVGAVDQSVIGMYTWEEQRSVGDVINCSKSGCVLKLSLHLPYLHLENVLIAFAQWPYCTYYFVNMHPVTLSVDARWSRPVIID